MVRKIHHIQVVGERSEPPTAHGKTAWEHKVLRSRKGSKQTIFAKADIHLRQHPRRAGEALQCRQQTHTRQNTNDKISHNKALIMQKNINKSA